jgi:hypothetical protein
MTTFLLLINVLICISYRRASHCVLILLLSFFFQYSFRLSQVVFLLCCLIHISGEAFDNNVFSEGNLVKRNAECDPEVQECLFENTLIVDLGIQTSLLDEDESRKSFELLTKVWINFKHH